MAKQLKTNGAEESANKTHNVASRTDAIRQALEQLYQEDLAIEAAMATHVEHHREHKRDIKKRMRDDYEISTKLLNARFASYKMERKAQANEDDKVADMLRELWEACPAGSSVDLVAAAETATQPSV